MIHRPVAILYDGNGNPLAVQNGVAIPANTSGVLVHGSDGTNARILKTDATGHQYTRPIQPITFTVVAPAVTPGNGKSMVSILNSSSYPVRIWKITMVNTQTTAVGGTVIEFQTRRFTGQSGGTSLTPSTNDSADAVDVGITARTGATLAGEASTFGRRVLYSSDEWTINSNNTEGMQQISQSLIPWLNYGDTPFIKAPTLRPGEGYSIRCNTNTAVGSWDIHFILTQDPS